MLRGIDIDKGPSRSSLGSFGLEAENPVGLEPPLQPKGHPATDAGEAAPAESGAESPLPPPGLPPIASKADDLDAIKKAVDDAASVGGGLWLSYLFVLFYLTVATGAVTHADLFLEKPVKLPFLGIELPLLAFFALAPILFIVVHAYTLVHLVMLTDKAKRFDEELRDQIGWKERISEIEVERRKDIRTRLRRQLPSNIFIYFLVGPKDLREKAFGWALRAIAWISLVVAPVLMLLLVQLQFLPYHYGPITWGHRGALLADLILVYWLWRKILSMPEAEPPNESRIGLNGWLESLPSKVN
jgi:hypothetical protein